MVNLIFWFYGVTAIIPAQISCSFMHGDTKRIKTTCDNIIQIWQFCLHYACFVEKKRTYSFVVESFCIVFDKFNSELTEALVNLKIHTEYFFEDHVKILFIQKFQNIQFGMS